LGCGLIQEEGNGPILEHNKEIHKSPVRGEIRIIKRAHREMKLDYNQQTGGRRICRNEFVTLSCLRNSGAVIDKQEE
jgi:hypothetical protein